MKRYLISMILFCSIGNAHAEWLTSMEVVQTSWGNASGQIGLEYLDPFDKFAKLIDVDNSGNIFIGDEVNRRVVIYDSNGKFTKAFTTPLDLSKTKILYWPYNLNSTSGEIVIETNGTTQFFNLSGEVTKEYQISLEYFIEKVLADGRCIYKSDNKYAVYSPTGEQLRTESERPLELGRVKRKQTGPETYKVTVTYPEKTWVLEGDPPIKFVRDINGNLYGDDGKAVYRFNDDGVQIASMRIPGDNIIVTPITGRPDPIGETYELIEEYGEAVIAPNGDVYTWKRTPDKYSIIKWTWQEPAQ